MIPIGPPGETQSLHVIDKAADGTITDADVQTVAGAVLTVGVIVWSVIEKKFFTK